MRFCVNHRNDQLHIPISQTYRGCFSQKWKKKPLHTPNLPGMLSQKWWYLQIHAPNSLRMSSLNSILHVPHMFHNLQNFDVHTTGVSWDANGPLHVISPNSDSRVVRYCSNIALPHWLIDHWSPEVRWSAVSVHMAMQIGRYFADYRVNMVRISTLCTC